MNMLYRLSTGSLHRGRILQLGNSGSMILPGGQCPGICPMVRDPRALRFLVPENDIGNFWAGNQKSLDFQFYRTAYPSIKANLPYHKNRKGIYTGHGAFKIMWGKTI
jgi:hypothetical protein